MSEKKSIEIPQVSSEFLRDNQELCKIISKSKNKKGGPYNKADREERRYEVHRLFFEYGYSAKKISELMKINRNTINGDIEHWYSEISKNWKGASPFILVGAQIERLDLQKTRLREYLDKTENLQEKLAIEKMILDVESKIAQTELKLCNSKEMVFKCATQLINDLMKKNKKDVRYISYGDMLRVPSKTFEKINFLIKNNTKV